MPTYFMALWFALILLDVMCGHIRSMMVVWLLAVSLAYAADLTTLIFLGSPGDIRRSTRSRRLC